MFEIMFFNYQYQEHKRISWLSHVNKKIIMFPLIFSHMYL